MCLCCAGINISKLVSVVLEMPFLFYIIRVIQRGCVRIRHTFCISLNHPDTFVLGRDISTDIRSDLFFAIIFLIYQKIF